MSTKNWLISIEYFAGSKNSHIILFEDTPQKVAVTYSFSIGEITYKSLIRGLSNLVGEIHLDSCKGTGLNRRYKKPNIEFACTSDLWRLPEPFYSEAFFIDLNQAEILSETYDYFLELTHKNQLDFKDNQPLLELVEDFNDGINNLTPEIRCFFAGLYRLKHAFLPIIIVS